MSERTPFNAGSVDRPAPEKEIAGKLEREDDKQGDD